MLIWPDTYTDWRDDLSAIEAVYVQLVRTISRYEKLLLVVRNAQLESHVQQLINDHQVWQQCMVAHVDYDDTWARDSGPITLLDESTPVLQDFTFNGWGGKFDASNDNAINRALVSAGVFNAVTSHKFILEGGSIESDGKGTLLTTQQCLLSSTRNSTLDKARIEATLKSTLGVDRVLWLSQGELEGDDTDAHIDTLARFCDENTIAYMSCTDPDDSHFKSLQAMQSELQAFVDYEGKPYRLIALPLPDAMYDEDGRRLGATYANFLIINGAVLVPVYNNPMDQAALDKLREAFPHREVIAIDCEAVIRQNGSLHCLTMQLPEGVL